MKTRIKEVIEKIFSYNPKLASIYYAVFSRAMSYEAYTALHGKRKFFEQESSVASILRRNIHRIEKGLIMVPRRDVFALEYIGETIDAYKKYKETSNDDSTIQWANDVLSEYFKSIKKNNYLEEMYHKYTLDNEGCLFRENHPFKRGNPEIPVSYESLYKLSKLRRSVRWYKDIPVPNSEIDKAIELAKLSPSACNRQPYKLKIFNGDKNVIKEISSLPSGTHGFNHNFPVIVAVIGQLRNYYSEADRHIIYIDSSLFAMSFSLALETLGLSSCIINWPEDVIAELDASKKLKLDSDERVIFFMSLGYADEEKLIPYSGKKSIVELREYC